MRHQKNKARLRKGQAEAYELGWTEEESNPKKDQAKPPKPKPE
jgi:hypothetical protein